MSLCFFRNVVVLRSRTDQLIIYVFCVTEVLNYFRDKPGSYDNVFFWVPIGKNIFPWTLSMRAIQKKNRWQLMHVFVTFT